MSSHRGPFWWIHCQLYVWCVRVSARNPMPVQCDCSLRSWLCQEGDRYWMDESQRHAGVQWVFHPRIFDSPLFHLFFWQRLNLFGRISKQQSPKWQWQYIGMGVSPQLFLNISPCLFFLLTIPEELKWKRMFTSKNICADVFVVFTNLPRLLIFLYC